MAWEKQHKRLANNLSVDGLAMDLPESGINPHLLT
jgi:hypothetical protein